MRWLSIFRDPRMWAVVVLAALFRVGWSMYWNRVIADEVAAYEANLAKLSPEERLESEVRTADALARNVLGVELGVEQALDEARAAAQTDPELAAALDELTPPRPRPKPVSISEIPVIRYDEPRGWEPPAWLIAGALGGLFLVAGAAGSWYVLRASDDDDEAAEPPPV